MRVRELELSVSPPADLAGFHESDAGFETRLVRSAMIFFLSKPGRAQRKVAVPVPGVAHHEDFASPQKLNRTEEHL